MKIPYKSLIIGFGSGIALLASYFLIMKITSTSFSQAFRQLYLLRFWLIPLILTFALQVGMYVFLRDKNNKKLVSAKSTALSTATSSTAMLACCAHHITDLLPVIGLSLFATFLSKYQIWFFGLAIMSNIIGILILYRQIKNLNKQ